MATCASCGTTNPDESKFCGNCGQALSGAPDAAPTEEVNAAPTPQHAAYEQALAAINAPKSSDAPTTQQPPATPTEVQPSAGSMPPPQPAPPTGPLPGGPGTGSNKKVLAIVGGGLALLAILAAVYFLVIKKDDPAPVADDVEVSEDATEAPVAEDTPVEAEPGGEVLFDSIAPLVATEIGPYSLTQQSSTACEPPCIFPDVAHTGSTETMQVTYDAGDTESQIYGEFLLHGTVEDTQAAFDATVADLEGQGFSPSGSFDIEGVAGTIYQDGESEIALWTNSNVMMGLVGNLGFPTELVGYL